MDGRLAVLRLNTGSSCQQAAWSWGLLAGVGTHGALPLFYALMPRHVLAAQPAMEQALCINRRRLVSPFDVHATLRALLSFPERPKLPDWSGVSAQVRPRSLLEEVPSSRSCPDAGIPQDSCPRFPLRVCRGTG